MKNFIASILTFCCCLCVASTTANNREAEVKLPYFNRNNLERSNGDSNVQGFRSLNRQEDSETPTMKFNNSKQSNTIADISSRTLPNVQPISNQESATPVVNRQSAQTSTEEPKTTTEEMIDLPPGAEVYVQPKNKEDDFDWKLSQKVFKEPVHSKKNVIISTVSIKLLLTILAEAAAQDTDSQTRTELKMVLPFDQSLNATRPFFENILDSLTEQSKFYTINIGTRGFVRESVDVRRKFKSDILHFYKVEVENLNFSQPIRAAKHVNGWVSKITNGKITRLVNAESLESSVMLLINAIYFKGVWKIPFEKVITKEFYITSSRSEKKDFVEQTGDYYYNYNTELKVRFLRLPYEGKRFSMFVILPFEKDGLADVIEKVNATVIRDIVDIMRVMQVKVTLPKFKFETKINLNNVIKSLGITEIFENSATLPNLDSHGQGMKVSNIIQKAGIVVDEKGSEAYAATEIDLVDKFGGDPREFLADHPFLFYIEDDKTGAKVFTGCINNPEFSI